jgi:hypothetical protein
LFLLILTIVSIGLGKYLLSAILIIINTLLILYVIDIRGIELDMTGLKILDYRKFLWFKIGKWNDFKNYNSVFLTRGKLVIRTSIYSEHPTDSYYYFFVKLVDEQNKKEIILAEFTDYQKAHQLLKNVSESLGIKGKINIKRVERIA